MPAAEGYVVSSDAVEPRREDGDTATVRVAIDESSGCERLEQRVVDYGPGRSRARMLPDRDEVLYVLEGRGTLWLDGAPHALEPGTAVYVAAGETYEVENPGLEPLEVVGVSAPAEEPMDPAARRITVRYADQPHLFAGIGREYRYLVNEEAGCREVTQFVGLIPPGRAAEHSHHYDEVVYILEGEGVLHLNGRETPISRGSCMHLPPLREHCLENVGPGTMRVLGVFHPSGSPASRAYEADEQSNYSDDRSSYSTQASTKEEIE